MSIRSVTALTRSAPTIAGTPTQTAPSEPTEAASAVAFDAVTKQPLPPRFPWLSRLSQQLESAARQKPTFASAPVLGDNVDRSA